MLLIRDTFRSVDDCTEGLIMETMEQEGKHDFQNDKTRKRFDSMFQLHQPLQK